MALLGVLTSVLGLLGAVAAQCDYIQEVALGVTYDIKSPGYPQRYPGGTNCRWQALAATGNKLRLSCGVFNIPSSTNCNTDRVSISLSGAVDLSDAHLYCGQGAFTVQSDANRLNMVLQSVSNSQGGVFLCNITAVRDAATCDCGWKKETRIVGGTETGVNEYPMVAGLVDSRQRKLYCGATIVSAHYALTAAHCLMGKSVSDVGLLVGDHDITTGTDTTASKLYRLAQFLPHPQYSNVTQFNDLGLVLVQGAIAFSREVMPACLPLRYTQYDFTGQTVEVLGWGMTEYGGSTSNVLMKADLTAISPVQCQAVFGDTVTSNQLCTYRQNKDACQSDSGGPVLWQDPSTGRMHLVAVISYGVACATASPSVNTRVTAYLSWIQRTSGEQFCVA